MNLNKITVASLVLALTAGCAQQGFMLDNRTPSVKPAQSAVPTGKSAWRQARESELADARAYADRATQLGLPASVKTAVAQKRDEKKGTLESAETLKAVTLGPLANDKIVSGDQAWASGIREMARRAALANLREPFQIVANVTAASKRNVQKWIDEGVAEANAAKRISVEYFVTKKAQETIVFYQPLEQE